jgi:hypothetical protein
MLTQGGVCLRTVQVLAAVAARAHEARWTLSAFQNQRCGGLVGWAADSLFFATPSAENFEKVAARAVRMGTPFSTPSVPAS